MMYKRGTGERHNTRELVFVDVEAGRALTGVIVPQGLCTIAREGKGLYMPYMTAHTCCCS